MIYDKCGTLVKIGNIDIVVGKIDLVLFNLYFANETQLASVDRSLVSLLCGLRDRVIENALAKDYLVATISVFEGYARDGVLLASDATSYKTDDATEKDFRLFQKTVKGRQSNGRFQSQRIKFWSDFCGEETLLT